MEGTTDYHEVLRQEYCPPLDESLFLAIVSEYDLDIPEQRRSLIDTLSPLKKSALDEEYADFDPTGTGGFKEASEYHGSAPSCSTPETESTSNGVATITTGISGLEVEGAPDIGSDLEGLSQEEKVKWLQETFPNIVPFETSNILKKCNGNLNHAVDNLLNLSFLPKGVDGFGQNEHLAPVRKGRGKKKSRATEPSRACSVETQYTDSSLEIANVWTSAADDVEFVRARTSLDAKTVKSVWHANGTSLPATIRALALTHATTLPTLADTEATIQVRVVDLKQDFPNVPEAQLLSILDLARNIPSAAHELIEVMVTVMHADTIPSGKVHSFAQYAPIRIDSDAERPSTPTKWATTSPSSFARHSSPATDHSVAASNAFQQAGSAYRRGKSDRLMGAAAAYYAQVGHEHIRQAKQQTSANANTHVAAQSSSIHVDLHGVSVVDAVRIARDRTEHWWESLGDTKYYSGANNTARSGFRIVTGVGKHSRDGALRIGPAVSKMLMREGWRAEVLAGEIIVRGKATR